MYKSTDKKLHEQIANQLIKKLEEGTAPWQLPWESASTKSLLPYNAVTGKRYKGINILSLLLAEYDDPRWVTYKQAASKGWQVKRGEKSSTIQFRKTSEFVPLLDAGGNKILNAHGKPEGHVVPLDHSIIKTAWVFNAQQVSGMPPLENEIHPEHVWTPNQRAESLIRSTGATINHLNGDKAFYNPVTDEITLPLKSQFTDSGRYFATALHELAHWTGHTSRLDRRIMNKVGSPQYAREELRAEIASLLVGNELKIGHDPGQHAAYVNSWIRTLRDTPSEIIAATADAERIYDYMLDYERLYSLDIDNTRAGNKNPAAARQEVPKSDDLSMGQEITVNHSNYKVTGLLKRGRIRLEELHSGMEISISRNDIFYQTLLQASKKQVEQEQLSSRRISMQNESSLNDLEDGMSR